ncbi:MAG: tRNA (N(6)-L-threonylcarbamoyladenosine(37)-C(2))-methylthiotransferase MtaB [Gammaproteobacteria bacterium]
MQIHLKTLGCRLNEAEIESWGEKFQEKGHKLTTNPEAADVLVVNTCAVTQEAVKKSRQLLRRVHKQNPMAKLVVSGCYSTIDKKNIRKEIPGIDLIVDNTDKDSLVDISLKKLNLEIMPNISTEPGESSIFKRGRNRAFIKIQDGCRHKCTFCIVTVARGAERSREENEIINEINKYHQQGIQEIVLTGVHVGGYGSEIESSLYKLIKKILKNTKIPRIRLASVEPWDLNKNFFSLFANKRLMPHIHLPLQSGCDTVLKRMARRCKTKNFKSIVEVAKNKVPNLNITTDIIVGYPGETKEEWNMSLDFLKEIGFSHIHIFTYSKRDGTVASSFKNHIDNTIKKERSKQLHNLTKKMRKRILKNEIGKIYSVLWESKDYSGKWHGYTENYLRVEMFNNMTNLENEITKVKIINFSSNFENCIAIPI